MSGVSEAERNGIQDAGSPGDQTHLDGGEGSPQAMSSAGRVESSSLNLADWGRAPGAKSQKMKSIPKLMCLNDLRPDLYCWWGIGE